MVPFNKYEMSLLEVCFIPMIQSFKLGNQSQKKTQVFLIFINIFCIALKKYE